VKLSAALHAIAGVFIALCGLQLVSLEFYEHPFLGALPYVLMGGGVGLLFLGTRVYRARTWAALFAVGLAATLVLILAGWIVYSFPAVFSCLVLMSVPLGILGTILGAVAIGSVRHAAAARARLDAAGMSLGL
jgi:hypothetical protein